MSAFTVSGMGSLRSCSDPAPRFTLSPGSCAMLTQTSPWSTTRTSLAMPSASHLRSSLRESGGTLLNWSQTPNWSQLQQLRPREERTWRKRVGVEPTIPSAKDGIAGFEGRGSHRTPFASGESIAGTKRTPMRARMCAVARCPATKRCRGREQLVRSATGLRARVLLRRAAFESRRRPNRRGPG